MKNKKYFIFAVIILLSALLLSLIYSYAKRSSMEQKNDFFAKSYNNIQSRLTCAQVGKTIGASGMPNKCCANLKPLGNCKDDVNGNCDLLACAIGGLGVCASCGDKICDRQIEGKCNCPEDCK